MASKKARKQIAVAIHNIKSELRFLTMSEQAQNVRVQAMTLDEIARLGEWITAVAKAESLILRTEQRANAAA